MERFTGHYFFCLALSRYLCLAHWILQLVESHSEGWNSLSQGMWAYLVLFGEVVQTAILADFSYLYLVSNMRGMPVVKVAEGIV